MPHKTMYRVMEHHTFLTGKYHTVFATMLYGSQNYQLSTPTSDVDTKAMLLPSFKEFALQKDWTSTEHEVGDGLANAKDVRAMFENYLKSNVNFLETLFTEFVVVNPLYQSFWDELQQYRDFIANANPLKLIHAAAGMAAQKFHALEKPFESKAAVLTQYGYDPKQLHHLVRLDYFINTYLDKPDFGKCLVASDHEREHFMGLKTNPCTLEVARRLATLSMENIEVNLARGKNTFSANDSAAAKTILDDIACRMLTAHLKSLL